MPRIVHRDISIFYLHRAGDGNHIVLIHGLAANLAFWHLRIVQLLPRNYGITTYDLRGHGKSDMPYSGYTTAHMVNDLHALLDHLELRQVHLIGHSFGGAVALHYTILHPERVASTTIADSRLSAFQPLRQLKNTSLRQGFTRRPRRFQSHPVQIKDNASDEAFRLLERMARAKLEGKSFIQLPTRDKKALMPIPMSASSAQNWLRLIHNTKAGTEVFMRAGLNIDRIQQIQKPLLALYGEYSHCLPSCRGLAQWSQHCVVNVCSEAGHFFPLSKPEYFAAQLQTFIAAHAA